MALRDKYKDLIEAAENKNVLGLQVREQDAVLYLDGQAPTGEVKDQLWDIYDKIDPNFLSGDLVMNIQVAPTALVTSAKVITETSNLNIRQGPGTDQPIVGKAAKDETVTVISRTNDHWWLVRTKDDKEGYAYARYLEPLT